MRKVFKYPLYGVINASVDISTSNCFDNPIFFSLQAGIPTLWFEEPKPGKDQYSRTFHVYGTGQEIPNLAKHIASWEDGPFIWHLYEVSP